MVSKMRATTLYDPQGDQVYSWYIQKENQSHWV